MRATGFGRDDQEAFKNEERDDKGRFTSGGSAGDKKTSVPGKKPKKTLDDKINQAVQDMKMKQRFNKGRSAA